MRDSTLFRASRSISTAPIAPLFFKGWGIFSQGKDVREAGRLIPMPFASVSSGLGDAPRNFARGFGAWQMDLAVRRDFPIHERLKLQFRAEAFNIFNHPNFGTINSQLRPDAPLGKPRARLRIRWAS